MIIAQIPADVPQEKHQEFKDNYQALVKNNNRTFMFVFDHTIEHLWQDIYGGTLPKEIKNPEHPFMIASHAPIDCFAAPLGLISRYALQYPLIHYVAKLSGKTNSIATSQKDPESSLLWMVDDVIRLKKEHNLLIHGVAVSIYIGSEYESKMLEMAAQTIWDAHQQGLVACLWLYARGKFIQDQIVPETTLGLASLANALGADIVKLKVPGKDSETTLITMQDAINAAGNTHILWAGGHAIEQEKLLKKIKLIKSSGSCGLAMGRNIFQHPLPQAISVAKQIHNSMC